MSYTDLEGLCLTYEKESDVQLGGRSVDELVSRIDTKWRRIEQKHYSLFSNDWGGYFAMRLGRHAKAWRTAERFSLTSCNSSQLCLKLHLDRHSPRSQTWISLEHQHAVGPEDRLLNYENLKEGWLSIEARHTGLVEAYWLTPPRAGQTLGSLCSVLLSCCLASCDVELGCFWMFLICHVMLYQYHIAPRTGPEKVDGCSSLLFNSRTEGSAFCVFLVLLLGFTF